MCKFLEISRSTFYKNYNNIYNNKTIDKSYDQQITSIFLASKKSYGKRMIKMELEKMGMYLSIKKIRKITKRLNLGSSYCKKARVNHSSGSNNAKDANLLNRKFNNQDLNKVLVSDLTYVKTGNRYSYVCFITDLFNKEIVGVSVGHYKSPTLVIKALSTIKFNLKNTEIFHTDRGLEFKNKIIDQVLNENNIRRSLSRPGNPYDNAVAESMFKTFKTTWLKNHKFNNIIELENEVIRYVKWYNNLRCHSSLGYLSPVEYRLRKLAA